MRVALGVLIAWMVGAIWLMPNSLAVLAEEEPIISLQEHIDQAASGDTIIIPSGKYKGPIRIDKPLALVAKDDESVTLINESHEAAITIIADRVQVKGITIFDEAVKETPSVLVNGNEALLEELSIVTGSYGIMMRDVNDGAVLSSTIEWGAEHVTSFSDKGNGIDLYNAHRVRLEGNTVRGMYDGIYLENSDDTAVINNRFEHSRYGVHCMYTKGTIIRKNTGTMNITGAMVMAAQDVELADNTFTKQSENVNSQGILLFDAQGVTVVNNIVEGNRVGLYVEYSTNNRLENNDISNNFIGIQLLESEQNTITANRFTGNVSDALTSDSSSNEIFVNYWDAFAGIDADGDGKSDIAYAMNPFFQGLIQKRPAFQIFFQNPGIHFLEGLYETNRSSWTTDLSPLMELPEGMVNDDTAASTRMTALIGTLLLAITGGIILASRRNSVW